MALTSLGLGIASLFGGNKSLSPAEKMQLYYGRVGKLRQKAELETNTKRRAKLDRKILSNESHAVRTAAKQDTKAERVPVKTFAELQARRAAYDYAIANPPASRSGTKVLRSL